MLYAVTISRWPALVHAYITCHENQTFFFKKSTQVDTPFSLVAPNTRGVGDYGSFLDAEVFRGVDVWSFGFCDGSGRSIIYFMIYDSFF